MCFVLSNLKFSLFNWLVDNLKYVNLEPTSPPLMLILDNIGVQAPTASRGSLDPCKVSNLSVFMIIPIKKVLQVHNENLKPSLRLDLHT